MGGVWDDLAECDCRIERVSCTVVQIPWTLFCTAFPLDSGSFHFDSSCFNAQLLTLAGQMPSESDGFIIVQRIGAKYRDFWGKLLAAGNVKVHILRTTQRLHSIPECRNTLVLNY